MSNCSVCGENTKLFVAGKPLCVKCVERLWPETLAP